MHTYTTLTLRYTVENIFPYRTTSFLYSINKPIKSFIVPTLARDSYPVPIFSQIPIWRDPVTAR